MSEATGTPRKGESRSAFRSETPVYESLYRGSRNNTSFQNKDLMQHLTEENHNMSMDSQHRRRTLRDENKSSPKSRLAKTILSYYSADVAQDSSLRKQYLQGTLDSPQAIHEENTLRKIKSRPSTKAVHKGSASHGNKG